MNTSIPLNEALRLCVSQDTLREWMCSPFSVPDWNAATDAHVLLGWKGDEEFDRCKASEQAIERIGKFLRGEFGPPCTGRLLTSDIRIAMDAWPQVDDYKQVKCKNCNGTGEDEEDGDDGACWVCDGTGYNDGEEVVGKKPDLTEKLFMEGVAYFMPGVWLKLIRVSELLGITEWTITHGDERSHMRLEALDGLVVMCVMPAMPLFAEGQKPFMTIAVQ